MDCGGGGGGAFITCAREGGNEEGAGGSPMGGESPETKDLEFPEFSKRACLCLETQLNILHKPKKMHAPVTKSKGVGKQSRSRK